MPLVLRALLVVAVVYGLSHYAVSSAPTWSLGYLIVLIAVVRVGALALRRA